MKKIIFKNLPDITTPMSASNLIKMQDNIEEAIIENGGSIKLNTISETEPTNADENDRYYNKTENKIYIYNTEWIEETTPSKGIIYINLEDECLYYYNGAEMIKASSSNKGIYIGSEEPTDEDVNFWINPDEEPTQTISEEYQYMWVGLNANKVLNFDGTQFQKINIDFNSKINSKGNFTFGEGKVKVGKGINLVKITLSVNATGGSNSNPLDMSVYNNDERVSRFSLTSSSNNSGINISIIPVKENDNLSFTIENTYTQSIQTTIVGYNNTNMLVEKLN